MLAENPAELVIKLEQIKALGVRLSLDDFGTGYSSLSNLSKFPFDMLKIDQSFVRAIRSEPGITPGNALVKAVINLGHTLGFQVLAEGVETEAQLQFLRTHGSDCMQGYLLSKPLTPQELAVFLSPLHHAVAWRNLQAPPRPPALAAEPQPTKALPTILLQPGARAH